MMFRRIFGMSMLMLLVAFSSVGAAVSTTIVYEATDLGAGRWQYSYDVTNNSLTEGIEEFTIWFEIGQYDNLAIETLDPPAANWAELVWDPEPALGDDGGYDAWAELVAPIAVGQTISGFAVSFDWLSTTPPGSQFYEIIDPVTFDMMEAGWTVPEPVTMLYLVIGAGFALRKKRGRKLLSKKM